MTCNPSFCLCSLKLSQNNSQPIFLHCITVALKFKGLYTNNRDNFFIFILKCIFVSNVLAEHTVIWKMYHDCIGLSCSCSFSKQRTLELHALLGGVPDRCMWLCKMAMPEGFSFSSCYRNLPTKRYRDCYWLKMIMMLFIEIVPTLLR